MTEKLALIQPEIALFIATCAVMIVGLSRSAAARRACPVIAGAGLVAAFVLALRSPEGGMLPSLLPFAKAVIAGVGLLLLLLLSGVVDREYEARVARGETFDPIRATRGEFYAFFLFSVTGVMLCATADDLIWLFLALELTSLPTYIMVAMSSSRPRAQEAAVKYFFLGAFGAAIFLYGFALLYGATGTTLLPEIARVFAAEGLSPLGAAGLVLALIGVGFKIAAVPMHFYTPDVYEGASAPVAAYLAFAPKTAGFLAILLLASTVGWTWGPDGAGAGASLPEPVRVTLWVMAALTMTIGNVLAILQTSVKRILAYSSIAHSGYMLVGVIAGPGASGGASMWDNGLAATLFYLLCYGVMNVAAFAVLACVERAGRSADAGFELETVDDLKGLCQTRPVLGWSMVLSVASLLGLPPLLGFFAKLFLFTSGIAAGETLLVVILGLNSAIAAFYYLRLVGAAMLENPDGSETDRTLTPFRARAVAALLSGASVVALLPVVLPLLSASRRAATLPAWVSAPGPVGVDAITGEPVGAAEPR